jgi:hypothetical protein
MGRNRTRRGKENQKEGNQVEGERGDEVGDEHQYSMSNHTEGMCTGAQQAIRYRISPPTVERPLGPARPYLVTLP